MGTAKALTIEKYTVDRCQGYIKSGNLKDALIVLSDISVESIEDVAIVLLCKFHWLEEQKRIGDVSFDDHARHICQIASSCNQLVKKLRQLVKNGRY